MKVTVRKREQTEETVAIRTEYIKLQDFLKFAGISETGGMAKNVIQDGFVLVNGEKCIQRGKKLRPGDQVQFGGSVWKVTAEE